VVFSKLNTQPAGASVYASIPYLTVRAAKLDVRMVCYSFPTGLFHSLQHAGLSRRTVCPRNSNQYQRQDVMSIPTDRRAYRLVIHQPMRERAPESGHDGENLFVSTLQALPLLFSRLPLLN
jgi:hypothetical protein